MKKKYTILFTLIASVLGYGQQNVSYVDLDHSESITKLTQPTNNLVEERNDELVFVKLRASTSTNSYGTDIYFNDNASLGFDFGYDAGFFGAIPAFVLYSQLSQNNVGSPYAIQAVNTTDLSNVTIPLGINASQGIQITFSIAVSTLPININIYLDDIDTNTSTLLNNSNYSITPTTALSGAGRFFLRISEPSTTYTYNGSWSPSDPNGTATAGDDIVIASGDATINANTTCNSVTVNPGAGLTIDSGFTLTASNGLTLESTSTNYSSLILDGTVSGAMTYQRHVNINGSGTTGSNDLISAPLTGQDFASFAAANPNIFNNGTLYLFGPFEKNTGQFLTYTDSETATLDPGVGYRAATSDNSSLTFTGTAENGNVSKDILNSGTNNQEWNLIGNPYPSYMNVQDFFLQDTGGGLNNIQLLDPPTAAMYGYDGSALNGWTVYNLATTTASTRIAPGQGFFISANAAFTDSNNIEFTPSMRRTGSGDDFIVGRNAQLSFIKLKASTSNNAYTTDIYFNNNASLGFDLGYDAAIWNNTTPDFAIYSHLIQNNNGRAMALQAVNSDNLSDVVVPLGVNANQGEQLTFSIDDINVPSSVNVYLDDTVANTSTLLNNSDYVVTPTTNLSGTGRFFLRTSQDALSTVDNSLDNLNIFTLNSTKELIVSGALKDGTVLNLYDIQGRNVMSVKLDSSNIENRIDTSNLSGGIYVVNVKNNTQQKTQKVVMN